MVRAAWASIHPHWGAVAIRSRGRFAVPHLITHSIFLNVLMSSKGFDPTRKTDFRLDR